MINVLNTKPSYFIPGKLYALTEPLLGLDYQEHIANTGPIHNPAFRRGDVLMFVRQIDHREMNSYADFIQHGLWLAEEKLYVFPYVAYGLPVWERID